MKPLLLTAIAPATAAQAEPAVAVEAEVPPLHCDDIDGRKLSWTDFLGKAVLIFFHSEQMAYSQQGLREVAAALQAAADLRGKLGILLVSNGERDVDEIRRLLDQTGVQWRLAVDPQRKGFAAYRVVAFPTAVLVGTDRKVQAMSKGYGPLLSLKVVEGARLAAGLITPQQYEQALHADTEPRPAADLLKAARTVRMVRQLIAAGMLDEARESLLRVIDAESQHAEGITLLAQVCLRQGRIADAERWIGRLDELAPTSVDARRLRAGVALAHQKPDAALALLDGLAEDDPEVGLLRGAAMEQKGDYRAAAALFRKALETALHR